MPSAASCRAAMSSGFSPSLTKPRLTQSLALVSLTRLLPIGEPPLLCSNGAFSRCSLVTVKLSPFNRP